MDPLRPCPVCRSADTRLLFRNSDFLFRTTSRVFDCLRCQDCGSSFLSPPPSDDQLRTAYPTAYWWVAKGERKGPGAWMEAFYRETVLRHHVGIARRAMAPPAGRVLDVGCGSGTFLHLLRKSAKVEAEGLEVSPEAAREAAKAYGLAVTAGSIEETTFPPETFSLVTLFHVLEHLREPVAALRKIHGWIRPGGRILAQVPNFDSCQSRLFRKRWTGIDIPRHLVNFTPASLRLALEEAGFKLVRLKFWSLRDDAPAFVSSLLPALDPVARQLRRDNRFAFLKNFFYLGLVLAATPLAYAEALAGKGATMFAVAEKTAPPGRATWTP